VHLILVFDRGYARVELIKDFHRGQQPFLIRAPHKVIVQTRIGGRRRRLSLGRLLHQTNKPVRYRHVLYHSQKAEPVDVIVYRQEEFQQAWFLVVPPDSESWLPTEEVVGLYRQRHAHRTLFSRLEEPFGPSGAAAPGAEDETHSASVDGIYAGLFALTVAGPRSAGRKTAPLFRTTAPNRSPRHAENLECPLDGYVPTLGSALGTTGKRTLVTNSPRLVAGRGVATLSCFSP
jgi:hypothetical protein